MRFLEVELLVVIGSGCLGGSAVRLYLSDSDIGCNGRRPDVISPLCHFPGCKVL